nr:LysM domain receptor-like kinase 3 [Tanacetum cinerariifolium]
VCVCVVPLLLLPSDSPPPAQLLPSVPSLPPPILLLLLDITATFSINQLGGLGGGLAVILAVVAVFVCARSSICYGDGRRTGLKDHEDGHTFHILRTSSFWCRSERLCCNLYDWRRTNTIEESSDRHTNILKVIVTDVFDVEKPVVFVKKFYPIQISFPIAVKMITTMKTKEFIAEMKVLCKVHHTNLLELIGYAASDDELFLIYEYAQKGSLGSHIHDPQSKDFGLAKLVGVANYVEAFATRVVGTFGYLAPEYLRDGLATTKSDVYAFGFLIFELISGKKALTRTETIMMKNSEKRSLASIQIVITLSNILLSSVEWEATLAGNSQVFSGLVQDEGIAEENEINLCLEAKTYTLVGMFLHSTNRESIGLFFEKLEDLANERINESNEMMDKVMTQMNDLYGLTEDECFNAMSVIARSALLIHIFDRLDEDGKVCMVQMVADGSVS